MRSHFVLQEIWIGLRRNLTMTMALIVVVAISLSLLGTGLLFVKQVDRTRTYWQGKVELSIYLCIKTSPQPQCQRLNLRLTVDNPEDLILCRAVFRGLAGHERLLPLAEIVDFLDAHPELTELVRPFLDPRPTWEGLPQASSYV